MNNVAPERENLCYIKFIDGTEYLSEVDYIKDPASNNTFVRLIFPVEMVDFDDQFGFFNPLYACKSDSIIMTTDKILFLDEMTDFYLDMYIDYLKDLHEKEKADIANDNKSETKKPSPKVVYLNKKHEIDD